MQTLMTIFFLIVFKGCLFCCVCLPLFILLKVYFHICESVQWMQCSALIMFKTKLRWSTRPRLKFWLKSQPNWLLINFFWSKFSESKSIVTTKLIKLCPDYIKKVNLYQNRSKIIQKRLNLINFFHINWLFQY